MSLNCVKRPVGSSNGRYSKPALPKYPAMQSSGHYPLKGKVHVDEFYVGGEEEGGKRGRGKGKKRLVIVALEIVKGSFGRAYAATIKDASSASFKPFFEKYIDKDAEVVTDEWAGYIPLKSIYKNLEQVPSKCKFR